MRNILGLLFTSLFFITAGAQRLELRDITSGKYQAAGVQPVTSSADGEYYFQADNKNTMIIKYSYRTGLPADTVFNVKRARECTFDSFQGFVMSPDEKRLLVYNDSEPIYRHSFKATYYYYDMRRNLVRKLTENQEKQSIPTFSRDGRMLAYVVNNNIWLSKFDFETESQVTRDGELGKIINGATDWVYEEEFRTIRLMDFSEDGRLLAFVRFDETDVPQYSMQIYGNNLYPSFLSFKYPKAGEQNSKGRCNYFDVDSRTIRKMDLPADIEYIPRIEFLPLGDELAIMTLNRNQNVFNMYLANARSAVCRSVLKEENDRYIDSDLISSVTFFGNQFIYLSEKSGYAHLYLYNNNGVLQKQLTSGNYDVTDFLAVDPAARAVFYQAAEESPLQRAIYRIDMVRDAKTKLSANQGTNTATFSKNGKYFINGYTNAKTPRVTTVHDATGKELRTLEDNDKLKKSLAGLNLPVKEFITVKSADGRDLNAYIMKPSDFNPSRKYPLVMIQYSGPNSQTVKDSYSMDWTDYFTTQGFIVAAVDGRGTGARGQDFRKCTYMNLGVYESDDQIVAAKHFAALPYIDGSRMAIWGWSYGGYNVLMSMSRGNGIFKAGVAIAPVTDWKFYDTVYTERFMRTPQQNASGYNNGSPIKLANKLEGNLLLIHGSADDNVHFQNTMDYAGALIDANKQFEMFVFTDKDHSIRGASVRAYLFEKVIKFLKTNM
jgi:dipeptidyl-peptidase-4